MDRQELVAELQRDSEILGRIFYCQMAEIAVLKGLTVAQMRLLRFIYERQPVLGKELADITGSTPSAITQIISTLEHARQVVRERNDMDRRATYIRVTPRGKKTLAAVDDKRKEFLAMITADIDTATLNSVIDCQKAMIRSGAVLRNSKNGERS